MYQSIVWILYNFALLMLLVLGSPWWLLQYVTSGRFREGLGQRFFGPAHALDATLPPAPRIWIHAVSVGEVMAISGLVRELETRALDYSVVVSTTTRTGRALAVERFGGERCFWFPLDFPWSVRRALKVLRPSMLVLAESELWPNVLSTCQQAHVPVIVVNARVSDRSLPRYQRLKILWLPFLRLLTRVSAQTEEDARRLQQIGIPAERIVVGGNLKFDVRAPARSGFMEALRRALPEAAQVLVCGSTVEGEEALLLEAWRGMMKETPGAVMILAPRHPERFEAVAGSLAVSGFDWLRRSQWETHPAAIKKGSVFLLDSIGELASIYALADVAFVGGSLVSAGGHNPLEPAQFGVPIAMGPHYENFSAIVELLRANDGICIVPKTSLDASMLRMLGGAKTMGANARRVFEAQAGATNRAVDAILELLHTGAR